MKKRNYSRGSAISILSFLLLFLMASPIMRADASVIYSVTDLGDGIYPRAMNDLGHVVGTKGVAGESIMFTWESHEGFKFHDEMSMYLAWSFQINNDGEVAFAWNDIYSKSYYWDSTNSFIRIVPEEIKHYKDYPVSIDDDYVYGRLSLSDPSDPGNIWYNYRWSLDTGFEYYSGIIPSDVEYSLPSELILPEGWVFLKDIDINASGQILAEATYEGEHRYVFMSPVPEPSIMLLLLCGILGLFSFKRVMRVKN